MLLTYAMGTPDKSTESVYVCDEREIADVHPQVSESHTCTVYGTRAIDREAKM